MTSHNQRVISRVCISIGPARGTRWRAWPGMQRERRRRGTGGSHGQRSPAVRRRGGLRPLDGGGPGAGRRQPWSPGRTGAASSPWPGRPPVPRRWAACWATATGPRCAAGRAGGQRLGGAAPGPVHAQADPPGDEGLPGSEGTLRPAVRLQAPGRHRVLRRPPRRERLPGLRPQVRAAGRGPVRRSQLRGLVQHARHDRAHGGRDRDELVPGREGADGPGRHWPAPDRPVQPARRARPGRAGRIVPHGGRGRASPWAAGSGCWAGPSG